MAFGLKENHGEQTHGALENPRVIKFSAMALTEVLKSKGINPPGISPEGAAWLAKTLHPADNNPPWTGIPVGSGLPSVMMEYEALLKIAPNAAAAGTWGGYVNLLPHPIQPLSAVTTDSVGDLTWGLRNPTLYTSGNTMSAVSYKLMAMAAAYKVVYASATVDLDAPALSNQGSCTCAQYPMQEYVYNPSYVLAAGADAGKLMIGNHVVLADAALSQIDNVALAAKPYSYSGLAKEGLYCVLKMDPNQEWVDARKLVNYATQAVPNPNSGGSILPLAAGAVGSNELFPWFGGNLPAADRFIFAYVNPATQTTYPAINGSQVPALAQASFARMGFWNLSVSAGLTIRVRWGVEYLVPPNSVLSPSVRACAPLDDIALTAYSRIVDQLPDAFPGSYNSWNDLGNVLRKIWTVVSPGLSYAKAVPGVPGAIATGIQAIGDMIASSTKQEKKPKQQASVVNMPEPSRAPQAAKKTQQPQLSKADKAMLQAARAVANSQGRKLAIVRAANRR